MNRSALRAACALPPDRDYCCRRHAQLSRKQLAVSSSVGSATVRCTAPNPSAVRRADSTGWSTLPEGSTATLAVGDEIALLRNIDGAPAYRYRYRLSGTVASAPAPDANGKRRRIDPATAAASPAAAAVSPAAAAIIPPASTAVSSTVTPVTVTETVRLGSRWRVPAVALGTLPISVLYPSPSDRPSEAEAIAMVCQAVIQHGVRLVDVADVCALRGRSRLESPLLLLPWLPVCLLHASCTALCYCQLPDQVVTGFHG